MSRRAALAVLAAAVAALATWAIVRAGRRGPTDEEAIRALFDDAARAAQERRVAAGAITTGSLT
jgi:hypothetical protein